MGANTSMSKNVLNQALDVQTNIINNNMQQCVGTNYQSQNVQITAGKNSTLTLNGTITLAQYHSLDTNCMANVSNNSQIVSDISVSATQTAKSIAQNFSPLTIAKADATNITNSLVNIGTTVTNNNYQICAASAYQAQQLGIKSLAGSTLIDNGTINYIQTSDAILSCVQTANNSSDVSNTVQEDFEQIASAITENAFGLIVIAVLLIVALLFMIEILAIKLLNWKTLLVIGGFVVLYFTVAYFLHIWPFKREVNASAST